MYVEGVSRSWVTVRRNQLHQPVNWNMATKVVDLSLEAIPAELDGLTSYKKVLVLFRYRGVPVGKVYLPVVNGRINHLELETAVAQLGWTLVRHKLHEYLKWDEYGPGDTPKTATVAVCTRDRPDDMRRCLEAFLRLPDDGQEFLVVDNAPSTNATRQIVESYNGRIRYIREDRAGLNVARNRALREARYDIIAFNDDDAIPDPGWLRALLRNFSDSSVLCVTGLTMPLELESEAQEWFERYSPFGRGFHRVFHYGSREKALGAGRAGAGANMAVRRSLVDKVGWFDEALDAGTPTRSGGDTEMFSRIQARGYQIVYDPAALTWHRHRRTWEELRKTAYGYGVGTYAFWTCMLLNEHRLGVVHAAWSYLRHTQLPMLLRAILRRPEAIPLDLVLAELRGCLAGPGAYLQSRRLRD